MLLASMTALAVMACGSSVETGAGGRAPGSVDDATKRLDTTATETVGRAHLQVSERKQGERDCSNPMDGRQIQPFVAVTLDLKPDGLRDAITQVQPLWREKFSSWFGEEAGFTPITDGMAADSSNYHLELAHTRLNDPTVVATFAGPCRASSTPGTFTISSGW